MDFLINRDNPGDPAGAGMVPGQYQERHVIRPDKVHQQQCRLERPAFGSRNHDNVAGHDSLAEFFRGCLYTKSELLLCLSDKQEGGIPPDEQQPVLKGVLHAADISSDWQLGQMGFFPMPLNRSPHSLHR
jgi:hypothetical protein